MNFKDNLEYIDTKDNIGDKLIFNQLSWVKIIRAILIKYTSKTEKEVDVIVSENKSFFSAPRTFFGVVLLSHDGEYHSAMLLAYGNMYWLPENGGISSEEPEDYFDWYDTYIKENNLQEPFLFSSSNNSHS